MASKCDDCTGAPFFSEDATSSERLTYYALLAVTAAYTIVIVGCELGPLFPECNQPPREPPLDYKNLDFVPNPCHHMRYACLLGLTTWECRICTRVVLSVVFGTIIGWERGLHGSTATGMRTMSVLCLGSCCFCISSVFAFIDGPMSWDASRSSAAIPTGVGFLGGATIWKGAGSDSGRQEIHGLTSAIMIWMTAAVGNSVGGGLFVPAAYTVFAAIVVLNFVPTHHGVVSVGPMGMAAQDLTPKRKKRVLPPQAQVLVEHMKNPAISFALNVIAVCVALYTALAVAAPWTAPECTAPSPHRKYANVDFAASYDPCKYVRYAALGGLNKWDADMCTRLAVSVFLGALVGWERRRADRSVGIRTMALVCLASSLYTLGGIFCEISGPSTWDSARVASSVVSGVSFIGGASIVKGSDKHPQVHGLIFHDLRVSSLISPHLHPQVHGLTTATSVWLSAALGLLAGGALYPVGLFAALTAVFYLRFGPRTVTAVATPAAIIDDDRARGSAALASADEDGAAASKPHAEGPKLSS